jgi:hypothetical protein
LLRFKKNAPACVFGAGELAAFPRRAAGEHHRRAATCQRRRGAWVGDGVHPQFDQVGVGDLIPTRPKFGHGSAGDRYAKLGCAHRHRKTNKKSASSDG